jgi:hypothetical protein
MSLEKPNIVMVVMDTARAQSLSCYGGEAETPFLSSLAKEGVKYQRAISQAVWTMPSHASMFTGKYQTSHHVMDAQDGDDFNGLDMVQERIAEEGYNRIGVVNVAFLWPQYGFDQYFDRYDYVNSNLLQEKGVVDVFDEDDSVLTKVRKTIKETYRKDGISGLFDISKFLLGEVLLLNDTGARETNRKALEHLEGHDSDEPFFLFLNYLEPHEPLSPPFPYSHKYLDNKFRWLSLTSLGIFSKYVRKLTTRFYDPENEPGDELDVLESLYNGEIEYLDGKLEELFSEIREEYPDTVFIVTSDHGEAFGEHGHYQHFASLWDEVTRVPLIESYPDGRSGEIEYSVETRQLHDHILDIARGDVEVIPDEGFAVSQYPGRNIEDYEPINKENLRIDLDKDTVSVEKDGEKVIRGYTDNDIRVNSDFREEEADEVSDDGLEEKAKKMIDKLKIFT